MYGVYILPKNRCDLKIFILRFSGRQDARADKNLHKSLAIPKVNMAKIGVTNVGIARPSDSYDPQI